MTSPTTLDDWLAHCERLHTQAIDMSLERVRTVRERLGLAFTAPLISVAGTNGKGSTCALIEAIARAAGWRVGVFSKPHLVRFEERCRVGGEMVSAASLLPHFAAVEAARGDITLTYFEFTLLAIARRLAAEPLDLVVLEVGLGGRLDAVNVFDADVAVLTSIDIDHTAYLGPDRESIGREKAGILRAGKPAIVADPMPPASVAEHARAIGADLRLAGRDFGHTTVVAQTEGRPQWSWHGQARRYHGLAWPALRGANQLLNASGALAALEALGPRLPLSAQAVRLGLARVELPGRFQIVPGQPALVLDVAHNPHSVATLAQNLDQMGFFAHTAAVFGAMHDKDLPSVVARIAPLVDSWYLCDLPVARAASASALAEVLRRECPGKPVHLHHAPSPALAAALAASNPTDRIVVFGSFYTVGGVLAAGIPERIAPHLPVAPRLEPPAAG